MGAFGRKGLSQAQAVATEKRAKDRATVTLPGNLDTTIARRKVTLVDVSAIGAQVSGPQLPPIGSFVLLRVGSATAFATVIWQRDEECGLQFDSPLADQAIAKFRAEAHEAAELGLNAEQLRVKHYWVGE